MSLRVVITEEAEVNISANAEWWAKNRSVESFTYDDRGRQHLQVSFEGLISENIYDSYGRLSHMNFYANSADRTAGTMAERWSYAYDSYGRKNVAQHSLLSSPGVFTP